MFSQFLHSCIVVLIFALLVQPSWAATDDFKVRLFVGTDTTAPTTPIITAATATAATAIDIVWSAAIDDVLLSGYRLYRNGVAIATTTLTSFSDTGLLPATLYTYTVDAFDQNNNISSTSAPRSTTTLAVPATVSPTTTPSGNGSTAGGTLLLSLTDFTILTTNTSAALSWSSNSPTGYILRFGRTSSYELGVVSGSIFHISHQTTLNQLEPGTRYLYELVAITTRGKEQVLRTGEFSTSAILPVRSPRNVGNFNHTVVGDDVHLVWDNPTEETFTKVRVVRSHLFYPDTPQAGAVVYEGTGQSVIDTDSLAARSPQYYTIFAYDAAGTVSSGAVTRALYKSGNIFIDPNNPSSVEPFIPPANQPEIGDDTILRADAIVVEQSGLRQALNRVVAIENDKSFVVSIPFEAVPRHLKSIIVTIFNPTDNQDIRAYLLKLNHAGTQYEAVLPATKVAGETPVLIELFDYNKATVRRIKTTLLFTESPADSGFLQPLTVWWDYRLKWLDFLFVISVATMGMLLWLMWRPRIREDNH